MKVEPIATPEPLTMSNTRRVPTKGVPQTPRITMDQLVVAMAELERRGEECSHRQVRKILTSGSMSTIVKMMLELHQQYRDGNNRFFNLTWKGCVMDRLTRYVWQVHPAGSPQIDLPKGVELTFEVPDVIDVYEILRRRRKAKSTGMAPDGFVIADQCLIETATPVSGQSGGPTLKVNPRTGEVLKSIPKGFIVETFLVVKDLKKVKAKRVA